MAIFPTTLNAADFGITATATDVALSANQWVTVASYTVPAQQQVHVGQTESISGGAQGAVAYLRLDDTAGAQMTAEMIRIVVTDANGINSQFIVQDTGTRWSGSATSRDAAKLLMRSPIVADEDSKIQIQVKTTKSLVVFDMSDTDNNVALPVTVRTGADRVSPRK